MQKQFCKCKLATSKSILAARLNSCAVQTMQMQLLHTSVLCFAISLVFDHRVAVFPAICPWSSSNYELF